MNDNLSYRILERRVERKDFYTMFKKKKDEEIKFTITKMGDIRASQYGDSSYFYITLSYNIDDILNKTDISYGLPLPNDKGEYILTYNSHIFQLLRIFIDDFDYMTDKVALSKSSIDNHLIGQSFYGKYGEDYKGNSRIIPIRKAIEWNDE